jgi:Sec-independent protein secretion pathway component TatC
MILGIVLILPATRKGLLSFLAPGETRMSGNVARQLIMMSLFFFWLAAFSFLGSEFMRNAHVIDGVNIWSTIQIQFVGGIVTALIGSSMLAGGLIVSQIKRPSSLLKPL